MDSHVIRRSMLFRLTEVEPCWCIKPGGRTTNGYCDAVTWSTSGYGDIEFGDHVVVVEPPDKFVLELWDRPEADGPVGYILFKDECLMHAS